MISGASLTFTYNDLFYNVWLYSVGDPSITSSAQVVEHPLVTGDKVMDHMYRNADSFRLTGTIGKIKASATVNGSVSNLDDFQELMENVKNNGVVCSLVKFKGDETGNASSPIFKIHENLVLSSIDWTERTSTLDYSFSFQEVMFADVEEYSVDVDDNLLPNIVPPKEKTFTESLFNVDKCMAGIVSYLVSEGVVTEEFCGKFFNIPQNKKEWLIGAGVGLATAGMLFISTPLGWGAAVVGVAVGLTVYAIAKGIKNATYNNKFKIKKFEKWSEKEEKRFKNFLTEIKDQLKALNTKVKVYQLDDEKDQQVVLSFDNSYYTFIFSTNNIEQIKKLDIYDFEENLVKSVPNLSSSPSDMSTFSAKTALVTTENKNYAFVSYLGENKDAEKKKLTNYAIVVSTIEPSNIFNAVINIVRLNIIKK